MPSLFEFSQSISPLVREEKFAEALEYFRENKGEFTPAQIGTNKYIVSDIIKCLIELNHYDAIFIFLEMHDAIIDPGNFPFLLKRFKDKTTSNWTVVNKFCSLISPDLLSTECRTIEVERNGKKRPMELASAKEDWYAYKTKALFEIQEFEECLAVSKKALESFEKFHYSNEVWFARRIALSKKSLGNATEALNELLEALKRKNEWYIQKEIADIYKESGDTESAFRYAIDAINNYGDLEYKVTLLELLGELLVAKDQPDLAFKHYSLAQLLRQDLEWSIPQRLADALNQFQREAIPADQIDNLIEELKQYWRSQRSRQTESNRPANRNNNSSFLTGQIEKILNKNERGADGFIKYGNNQTVYFRVKATDPVIQHLTVGVTVSFKIYPATDGKKDQAGNLKVNK